MSANLIGKFLPVAHIEVSLLCVSSTGFQDSMEIFYQILCKRFIDGMQQMVKGNEMVCCLDDVIHRYRLLVFESYSAGFKDIARLVFGKFASLYTVGIIGKLHLGFMI